MTYPEEEEHLAVDREIDMDLAQLKGEYERIPVDPREGGDEVPDGTYQVNVENVDFARAKKTGNKMLKWKLRVISGAHKKRVIWRHSMFATPDNRKYLKADLVSCGLEIREWEDLPAALPQLLDVKLEVRKVTKPGQTIANVYFQRRIDVSTPVGEDDPPF